MSKELLLTTRALESNCKQCGSNLTTNYGGVNGYCSDCLQEFDLNRKVFECIKCSHTWKFRGKYYIGVRCPKCYNGYRELDHQKEYYYSPQRQAYLRQYRQCVKYKEYQLAYRLRQVGLKNPIKVKSDNQDLLCFRKGDWRNLASTLRRWAREDGGWA